MDKRSIGWSLVAAAAACAAFAAMPGCELLVDFDRSKIPQEAGTGDATTSDGSGDDVSTDDGSTADTGTEAGGDGASEAATDGGTDASDATGDAISDGATEAATEAGVDAGSDGSDGAVGTAAFTISPAAVTFGTVALTTTTAAYQFTVTNGGTAGGTPTVAVAGTNPGDFVATGCGSSVAAGGTCTLNVTFLPGAAGARAATISVGTGTPAAVTGTGAANGPLTITPTTQDFGTVMHGTSGTDVAFTVKNTDAANDMTLVGPTFDGQDGASFAVDADGGTGQCGTTLAANTSCTLFVHFAPGATTGFYYGSLSISGTFVDGGAASGTASASLTGTAN